MLVRDIPRLVEVVIGGDTIIPGTAVGCKFAAIHGLSADEVGAFPILRNHDERFAFSAAEAVEEVARVFVRQGALEAGIRRLIEAGVWRWLLLNRVRPTEIDAILLTREVGLLYMQYDPDEMDFLLERAPGEHARRERRILNYLEGEHGVILPYELVLQHCFFMGYDVV